MRFWKYQALGNDFVLLDRRMDGDEPSAELARSLCDRRLCIGADGLIVLLPPRDGGDARMVFRNADGSTSEMCGNGIRCLVKHLHDADPTRKEWVIATDSGLRRCVVLAAPDGEDDCVEAEMGPARIEGVVDEPLEVGGAGGTRVRITRVLTGNPHAVTFDDIDADRQKTLGPAIERDSRFPNRTNVEFATQEAPGHLAVIVWERGVGFTRACGTGACAAAAAACSTGRAPFDEPLRVSLPGGSLVITVPRDLANLRMRGPAVRVFEGTL